MEFVRQDLTSYGGLELLRRYFRLLGLHRRIRQAFHAYGLGGDYGGGRLVLLLIALFVVGARRLEHLRYLAHDPLVARLCGLARIPSERTVVNWLKQFTQAALQAVIRLNSDLLYEQIEQLGLPRLTIDVDGTVIRTGGQVAWAFRGFNPHHRKDPSYYPLLAHLAQTGQILRLRNRPGNVHDSRGAEAFLRDLLRELRGRFGRRLPVVGDVAVYVAFPVSPSNRSHSMRATRPRRPGWDIGGSGQAGQAGLAEGIVLSVGK